MRILVISRNAWDDTNSIGNTVSNFFAGIGGIEFASIYFRSSHPSNMLCKRYYQTSEIQVLKKWFSPGKIGKHFYHEKNERGEKESSAGKNEKAIIRLIQKHGLKLAYKFSDYIWYSKKWINGNLRRFVEDFSPDLVFTFVKSAPQYYLTVRYLRENFNVPVMSWIADDEYTSMVLKKKSREIENLRYILKESAVVWGCSQEICDYYNSVFGCAAVPLYKGCVFTTPVKTAVNEPIKLVYAGNLLYGRMGILRQITQTLDSLAGDGVEATLQIYSNMLLSAQDERFFAESTCAKYMGQRNYEQIKRELASADVVLHVESFEEEQLLKTRYSFSTKIIDALQSGSVFLAVGPAEQASMRYIRSIPGTCVIHDLHDLAAQLAAFLADASSFSARAEAIRDFALRYHDSDTNAKQLQKKMKEIIEGDK